MKGEEDRECRARGGHVGTVFAGKGSPILREFKGAHPHNTPDASSKRGSGPIFRKKGGKIPASFKEHEFNGRKPRASGGSISGAAAKPSGGRPGRKLGGRAGHSDLSPTTSAETPRKAEDLSCMPDSERTP
jgi:hypothetical protein